MFCELRNYFILLEHPRTKLTGKGQNLYHSNMHLYYIKYLLYVLQLIQAPSPVSCWAYKILDAYNFFVCGHV